MRKNYFNRWIMDALVIPLKTTWVLRNHIVSLLPVLIFTAFTQLKASPVLADTGINLNDSLRHQLENYPNQDTIRLELLLSYSRAIRNRNPKQAEPFAAESIELSKNLNHSGYLVKAYGNMGHVLKYKKDYEGAITFMKKCQDLNRSLNNELGVGMALNDLSGIYRLQDKNTEALATALESIRVKEKVGGSKKSLAFSYRSLGEILIKIQEFERALTYFQQAKKMFEEVNYLKGYNHTLGRIGATYRNLKRLDSALYYHILQYRAYSTDNKRNEKNFGATCHNIGSVYSDMSRFDSAMYYYKKSLFIKRNIQDTVGIIRGLNNVAVAHYRMGDYTRAIAVGQEGLALARKEVDLEQVINTSAILSQAYEKLRKWKEVAEYQKINAIAKDSLFSQEKILERQRLVTEHEVIQIRRENDLLQIENELELSKRRTFIAIIVILALLYGTLHFYLIQRIRLGRKALTQRRQMDIIKSRFFSNISHEQRTPLTLIAGPLNQLLKQQDLPADYRKKIQTAVKNSERLGKMTDQIMELSKLEAGKLELALGSVNLKKEIGRIYSTFHSMAITRQIDYRMDYLLQKDKWITLDRGKFETILTNLIGNAFKYTPDGGEIIIVVDELDKDQLKIVVKDTGRGIHKEDVPHIFDRYYQSSHHEAVAEGGVGIGLALASELTQLFDGRLTVKSKYGAGSKFTFTLPMKQAEALEEQYHSEEPPSSTAVENIQEGTPAITSDSKSLEKVLIVEDDDDMRDYLEEIISPHYHHISAENGKKALDLIQSGEAAIDLIITDVMMPELDGLGLLAAIRQNKETAGIPVIMLTALSGKEQKLSALLIGVDDYLTKPFSEDELLARCGNRLSGRSRLKSKPTNPSDGEEDKETHTTQADLQWLKEVETILVNEISNPHYNMARLSHQLALSERQIRRRLKKVTQMSPNQYFREIRLNTALHLLETGQFRSISEVSYQVGFETPGYFSRIFRERFGKDAADYIYDLTG